ncbi:DEAD/DEAH box helicase family protein [Catenovulum sp. SM1970]|uniref:DEAD/DEAH box helicase n=1 Tax=Marinifaba aquimaris TaxID=2741323 RepID=UPI0015737547|nr:DEAD/DEAH box helicase [Marinifaba aquimaris]NTS77720.1 DEAD/DEAH box helicase family protein [Marinifaba aquimaris]
MVQLRDYQQQAVDATINHFKQSNESAVIVLPTGSGKSLVIAELARLAKGRILVLTHVKELVEQNHQKYQNYGLTAGLYSAGLKLKQTQHQVTFASIQSVGPNLAEFTEAYSLVIVDECHRIKYANKDKNESETQYQVVFSHLKQQNPKLKILGLTATPYRMGMGWIYQYHYFGIKRSEHPTPFVKCIFEFPLSHLIKKGYLTPPIQINAAVEEYDFSELKTNNQGEFNFAEVNKIVLKHPRVTQGICQHILELAKERQGVMIFAASVEHAQEIVSYLPKEQTALVTGNTKLEERDEIINAFKAKQLKFLVNVSVLTTGFDAPHVDYIALLRPTQSIGLFQQIVGRGLRLAPNKKDCLVIDYAGNGYDIFLPEVGEKKPNSDSQPVMVKCPLCDFANTFWGKVDKDNNVIEHYGRRCWGYEEFEHDNGTVERFDCQYRFKFKQCPHCNVENDIAARKCHSCGGAIIDPDEQLREALNLKGALVMRCSGVTFEALSTSKLKISYHDEDGLTISESVEFIHKKRAQHFNQHFGSRFNNAQTPRQFSSADEVIKSQDLFVAPDFVIAYKDKKAKNKEKAPWLVKDYIFDYEGKFRKANQLY